MASGEYIEVPLAEENLDSSWQTFDFSDLQYVIYEDSRCRRTVSSALNLNFGSSSHAIFW